jgi:hypothetical protein
LFVFFCWLVGWKGRSFFSSSNLSKRQQRISLPTTRTPPSYIFHGWLRPRHSILDSASASGWMSALGPTAHLASSHCSVRPPFHLTFFSCLCNFILGFRTSLIVYILNENGRRFLLYFRCFIS